LQYCFEDIFRYANSIIRNESNEQSQNDTEVNNCYFFLSKITKVEDRRDAGHYGLLYIHDGDYEDYCDEIDEWYILNKDDFTMKMADSIFLEIPENYRQGHIDWKSFLSFDEKN